MTIYAGIIKNSPKYIDMKEYWWKNSLLDVKMAICKYSL